MKVSCNLNPLSPSGMIHLDISLMLNNYLPYPLELSSLHHYTASNTLQLRTAATTPVPTVAPHDSFNPFNPFAKIR